MTATCPTCHAATDTPALAFLHERVHAKDTPAVFVFIESLPHVASIMEAYAAKAVEAAADKESRQEEKQRIAKIKRATCEGCLAAAMGLPLHTVAESGYAARSYCGDGWEAGWEFINGSATWQEHVANEKAQSVEAERHRVASLQAERDALAKRVAELESEAHDG